MTDKKIVITGGHHNSALAVVDWLEEKHPGKFRYIWIGKKNFPTGQNTPEYTEVTSHGVRFFNINAGKLFRTTSLRYLHRIIANILLIPVGFLQALWILLRIHPDLVVSFGGYIAIPVVVWAKILGIKAVTHEQTTVIGLANRIILSLVDVVYTAWPVDFYRYRRKREGSFGRPPAYLSKFKYVGLPLREAILKESAPLKFSNTKPVVYITGGKSGSEFINALVKEDLPEILKDFNIIWSLGGNASSEFISSIEALVKALDPIYQKSLVYKKYFSEDEAGQVFAASAFVISRGGAHTLYELLALKKPAIIIPIPWTSNNEQVRNAQVLADIGLAKVLDQETLASDQFRSEILEFHKNINIYKNPPTCRGNLGDKNPDFAENLPASGGKADNQLSIIKNGTELLGQSLVKLLEK